MQNNKPKKNFTDLISGIVVMALAAFFYWTTIGTKSFMRPERDAWLRTRFRKSWQSPCLRWESSSL